MLGGALLLGAWAAADGKAAVGYDVYACRMPSGSTIADFAGWTSDASGEPASRTCAGPYDTAGSAVWPRGLHLSQGEGVGVSFTAPSGTHLARVELLRWFDPGDPNPNAQVEYRSSADGRLLESCHIASCAGLGSKFVPAAAEQNRVTFAALDARRLSTRIECAPPPGCSFDPSAGRPSGLAVLGSRVTLVDDVPPQLPTPPSGSLLDPAGPMTGERALRFHATDVGAGLADLAVVVDGVRYAEQRIAPNDARCREPFTVPVPCPLEHEGTIAFDTASVPNGEHTVRLSIRDVSGNEILSEPYRIATRNRSAPNGAGASSFARVRAWLPSRGRRDRTARLVAYGRRVALAGALLDEHGRPIAGATLDVLAKTQRIGAVWRKRRSVVTDARGRFRADLPPGPSRLVRVGYRAYSLDGAYAATADTTIRVRAGVRFSASPRRVRNGSRITFRGRVLGGPSRVGVTVVVYAVGQRVDGRRARVPVEALTADRRGRFRYRYQFRNIAGPFHYRFQAHVRTDRGYPYAPGRSRIVHVSARP